MCVFTYVQICTYAKIFLIYLKEDIHRFQQYELHIIGIWIPDTSEYRFKSIFSIAIAILKMLLTVYINKDDNGWIFNLHSMKNIFSSFCDMFPFLDFKTQLEIIIWNFVILIF